MITKFLVTATCRPLYNIMGRLLSKSEKVEMRALSRIYLNKDFLDNAINICSEMKWFAVTPSRFKHNMKHAERLGALMNCAIVEEFSKIQ